MKSVWRIHLYTAVNFLQFIFMSSTWINLDYLDLDFFFAWCHFYVSLLARYNVHNEDCQCIYMTLKKTELLC